MRVGSSILLLAAGLLNLVSARSSTGDRVLVVLEPSISQKDYSKFFGSLKERGFNLSIKSSTDTSFELISYGENQYDHVILYTPSVKPSAGSLTPQSLLEAQFAGINTLYLLSSNINEYNRETMREYDLEFLETPNTLLDAFGHVSTGSISDVLLSPASCAIPYGAVLSSETLSGGPIVYPNGVVHTLGLNPYGFDILHSPKTSYIGSDKSSGTGSKDEKEVDNILSGGAGKITKDAIITGKKAGLVSALQTRDNVRIGFVGSGAMFSDKWWDMTITSSDGKKHKTGNAAFAKDLTSWIFQETGVLKVIETTHHKEGESSPQEIYYKRDNVVYSITLAKYYSTQNNTGAWGPFKTQDLQLEFTMLDPHYRQGLVEDKNPQGEVGTAYTTRFVAPDRHGVFKFNVEYWRPGWSYIRSTTKVSVAPLRHDQHPRFVVGAWPFYLSTISISIAFLLFCGLWVVIGEGDRKGKKKAE